MTSPTSILLQITGSGKLGREEAMMADVATQRGIPVVRASEKQVERAKIAMPPGMVAVGSVPFIKHAIRQMGSSLPEHTPYPKALESLLFRSVKKLSSIRDAKLMLDDGKRFFIKPADGWKRFTGFVAEFSHDYRFNGMSNSKPVWVSDPVNFVSEWRAYVAKDVVREVKFADHGGDRTVVPDLSVIEGAVNMLAATGSAPSGYVIDFGVLNTGETALIEMNDGFSFGAYDGLLPETYWDVTVNRWLQLTNYTN
ncbi:MAG: ATP-grasp domain-containing protein [Polynucleobacter sp.]|uniref:ATP-grasp domain-containing protein n=1 Tax=Polynucleobacter sp. TaxID=2029855 RepID=UPI002728BDFF|nr:ATP-grasp domain-containing protein [Polynucleobacter sp.]MDO8713997.1 ATP-grasp domain-containing protein [Polynucleobacter sp.]